jgi:hypothetical protein
VSDEATIGKTIFKIFSRTTGPERLKFTRKIFLITTVQENIKFTWKLLDIDQNQVSFSPGVEWIHDIETVSTYVCILRFLFDIVLLCVAFSAVIGTVDALQRLHSAQDVGTGAEEMFSVSNVTTTLSSVLNSSVALTTHK